VAGVVEVPASGLFAMDTGALPVLDALPPEVDFSDCVTALVVAALLLDVDCVDCVVALVLETPIVAAILMPSPSLQQVVFPPWQHQDPSPQSVNATFCVGSPFSCPQPESVSNQRYCKVIPVFDGFLECLLRK
jgi:hypothetical protein